MLEKMYQAVFVFYFIISLRIFFVKDFKLKLKRKSYLPNQQQTDNEDYYPRTLSGQSFSIRMN